MGHIDKHLEKTDKELILRLFKDWKLFSGVLYDGVVEMIHKSLKEQKFDFKEQDVLTLKYGRPVGYGYDRFYDKILSNAVKVVLIGNNENYEIITAYPDLENGTTTEDYYEFRDEEFSEISKENTDSWKLFKFLVSKHFYEVRYMIDKKPYVRVYLKNYMIKIKNDTLILVDDSLGRAKQYQFEILKISKEDLLSLLVDINNFKESYTIFGANTIDKYIQERLAQ